MPKRNKDLLLVTFDLIDTIVELYLQAFIRPFLKLHETFYGALNVLLRTSLEEHKQKIPEWFTANFITYMRTSLVVPTVLLLAGRGHAIIPAILVIAVDFADFLDGVVARFWVDVKKERAESMESKDKGGRSSSPTGSDDESFEVVTTGSPHTVPSWTLIHRNRTYGEFVDAVCDKAFVIPCWISLIHLVPYSGHFKILQYFTLVLLCLAETATGCIRFQAYFSAGGTPPPKVEGFDLSSSAVKADHVGKAKQTFEMMGTALFILPLTRYIGLMLLLLALPLAYESVRRKMKQRVIYVNGAVKNFDHKTLKFWMQAKTLGSKLIVGIPGEKTTDMILNACASSSVDEVIAEAPAKADVMFLEKNGIDFVLTMAGQPKFVTDEVVNAERVLAIGEDGVARLLKPKSNTE